MASVLCPSPGGLQQISVYVIDRVHVKKYMLERVEYNIVRNLLEATIFFRKMQTSTYYLGFNLIANNWYCHKWEYGNPYVKLISTRLVHREFEFIYQSNRSDCTYVYS